MSQPASSRKQNPRYRLRAYHFIWEVQALGHEKRKKEMKNRKRHSNVKCVPILLGAAPKWATETQKFAQVTCSLIWGYVKCSKRSCILNESLEKEWRRNLSQSFSSPIFEWTKYPLQGANSLILWPLGEGEARTRALGHDLVSKSVKMGDPVWVGRSARDKGGSLRGFKGSTMFASQYRGFGASGHVMEIHVPGQDLGFFQGLSNHLENCLFYKTKRQASGPWGETETRAEKQEEGLHK